MSKLVEEEVEVVGEVLAAASSRRSPPPKSWVSLLGMKVTVEAMVDTVGKRETHSYTQGERGIGIPSDNPLTV